VPARAEYRRKENFMKLNPECIRDILFYVEENTDLDSMVCINPQNIPASLSKYPFNEIQYHVKQCELSGLFGEKVSWYMDGGLMIRYLSPAGHKFISDIRSDNAWAKTKQIAGNIGANSIDTLKQIATGVITTLIQNQLHLS